MGRMAVAAAVILWAIPISLLVNSIVPLPYMDEIFHVPQAQKFCNGDFWSWDPMITTPPGLYGLSLAYIAPLFPAKFLTNPSESQYFSSVCTTPILRSTNIILAIICSILVHEIIILLKPGISQGKATCCAILAGLYPVHWFFTFLYYTDVASLAAVLTMYFACLKKRYWISAMFGALAILCRQTNAIWVLFIAANGAISYIEDLYKYNYKVKNEILRTEMEIKPISQNLRRRQKNNEKSMNKVLRSDSIKCQLDYTPGLIGEIINICQKFWVFKWRVLIAFMPFILVLFAFASFIFWNGGIVLGAKEAHVVSPHFAQIFYFALVSASAAFPLHFYPHKVSALFHLFMKNKIRNIFLTILAICLSTIAIHYFSIAHPYLLADNRHYPFYIWRKIIKAHWSMKYNLIPLYIYSWFSIITTLGKENKWIWIVSYVVSVALVLVPAPLIELRYFTIPLILSIIHSPIMSDSNLLILGFIYALVDIVTIGLFLFKPFKWEHEISAQRFMW